MLKISSDTELREDRKGRASSSETADDTLEAEISKLETTINSIKDDLPDINNCSYELQEGDISDIIIDEDIKGKQKENKLPYYVDSTDLDAEVIFFGTNENDTKQNKILKLKENNVGKNRHSVYSNIESIDGEILDSDVDVKTSVKRRKEKCVLKFQKNKTKRNVLTNYTSIDSADGEILEFDAEVKTILENRKKNVNNDFYKQVTPKHVKGKKSSYSNSILSPELLVSPTCVSCKENFHVPIYKKKCDGHGSYQSRSTTPNKKNKSCFNRISDNSDNMLISPKSSLSSKTKGKRKSNYIRNKKCSAETDVGNDIVTIDTLSENHESKKSDENLTLKVKFADESYIESDISKELEDTLLYPDDYENENIASLNKTGPNAIIVSSTPHRIDINSHKIWKPEFFPHKESFLVLDETVEFSDQEQIVSDIYNSPSNNLVSKETSECTLTENLVKINDVNTFKPINTVFEKYDDECEKSKVINGEMTVTNRDRTDDDRTLPANREYGRVQGNVILKKPKSTSPYVFDLDDSKVCKKDNDDIKENKMSEDFGLKTKESVAKDNKENTSHDKGKRHVEFNEGGDLKIMVNVIHPVVVDNYPQLLEQNSIAIQTLVQNNDKLPMTESESNNVPIPQTEVTDKLNVKPVKVAPQEKIDTESSDMGVSIDQAYKSPPKEENINKEPEIIVPNDNIPSEDAVPKASGRRDEDYISNNPQENADNNNPEWELLRKLETDEERYRAMRKRWRNLVIPDPNKNLTCLNWRMIHNASSASVSNNGKISDLTSTARTNPKLNEDNSASANTQRENRKRPRSVDSAIVKNEYIEKRPRTQSCTTVYEVKLEQLKKNIQIEKDRIDSEEQLALLQLSFKQSEELNRLQQSCSSYVVHEAMHQLLSEQHEDVERIRQKFHKARCTVQDSSMNKVKMLEKACEEVRAFHMFYSGLDPESQSGDTFYLTNTQLQELWETERLYEQYKIFYSV